MWHCPHCGAPQAETARCWVCRRSSTTCSTCRHFRASLAADVGYCALDRRRTPLTGRELRACWSQPPATAQPHDMPVGSADRASVRQAPAGPLRGFVPLAIEQPAPPDHEVPAPIMLGEPAETWEARTSLFGELDR